MTARAAGLGMLGRWIFAACVIVLMGAAIGLWARHGAAVFFDMLSAGIAYCF